MTAFLENMIISTLDKAVIAMERQADALEKMNENIAKIRIHLDKNDFDVTIGG